MAHRSILGNRSYPQAGTRLDVVPAEPLPVLVADPFDPARTVDLTKASGQNFNLVDGTVSMAVGADMPFVLFKGYNPDTWFYAPRWGRIAKNAKGEPDFTVTVRRRRNPDGTYDTLGGILSFMIELVVELPGESQRKQWTELIKKLYEISPAAGAFSFQPLGLSVGKMNVYGLDKFLTPDQRLKNIDVGASSTIAFAYELNPEGAEHFQALMGRQEPIAPQVAIMFDFNYESMIPKCRFTATGLKKKCYDYFSINQKARASYFGLVEGAEEVSYTRTALRQEDALKVEILGDAPANIDVGKLVDSVFDRFVKMNVGAWIAPSVTPVETANPEGFYGGVTVSMKNVDISDTAVFDEQIDFGSIDKNLHQVSFNFEQQLGEFDPAKHLVVEDDPVKLPFKISIGSCDKVASIAVSASYTTAEGPRSVQCPAVTGQGGMTEAYIQYTWPQRPTSAQLALNVTFIDDFGPGYVFPDFMPVSDVGASYLFEPDQFIQRTTVYFLLGAATTAESAMFSWEWQPPAAAEGETPRKKSSGFSMLVPDADKYNLLTCGIAFPYRPTDWRGAEETPKVKYVLTGLRGEWAGKKSEGSIQIGDTALVCDWKGVMSLGETLDVPGILTQGEDFGPSPVYSRGSRRAKPVTGPQGTVPVERLGYVPGPDEPTLVERERIALASLRAAPTKPVAYPAGYDLRSSGSAGRSLVTTVKEQGDCDSCVAFAVCGAVESALQVRHADPDLAPDLSEAHLFYCLGAVGHGRSCETGWYPGQALEEFEKKGVVDEACFPYEPPASPSAPVPPCTLCPDSDERLTRIANWTVVSRNTEMKELISGGQGPLVAGYSVYQDFLDYFGGNHDPQAVYRKGTDPGSLRGGHCVCVVGYSDEGRYWICKNSWGDGWADDGFFKIGYGEAGIDSYMWAVDVG
ncbi:C1 family peptidase [Streptomyces sp. NRRL F-2890]|uniref:C1 family peptidase n=1 Tax=Streptomyces sp. NRRL F-2890 TaxID=1463845 RepID=UPI0006942113|nr:C1 family peptidase [Streptomyces sp. NRRL F-2890]